MGIPVNLARPGDQSLIQALKRGFESERRDCDVGGHLAGAVGEGAHYRSDILQTRGALFWWAATRGV